MKLNRLFALPAVLLVTALGVAACGGGDDEAAQPAGAGGSTSETMTGMESGEMETGTGETMSDAVAIESPAADLRVTLDRLLSEHAVLAIFAMQKGYDGDEDFDQVAAALDGNTDDLGDAIGSVYGDEAQEAFEQQWRNHIGFFVDYTVATAGDDEAGRKQALAELNQYRKSFSQFLQQATGLEAGAAADALQMHVGQLTKALDEYAGGDYEAAYGTAREAYAHMYDTGDALAGAIVEQQGLELDPATQSAVDLRLTLDRLLGEHALLAAWTMQKGFAGSDDFDAAAAALSTNTADLTAAIGSVYGEEAAATFDRQWSEHIGFFVDYTVATAEGDEQGRQAALDMLDGYRQTFANFLGDANPNIDPTAIADGLQMHVDQLTAALDTFAEGSFDETYEQFRTAYVHMFETADALSGAIVKQFPEKFAS